MLNKYTTDPLTVEEEVAAVKAWRDRKDTKARDRLIFANLRFAMRVIASAKRIAERDDLEQEAVVAMLDSLKNYDPDRGYRFITYAVSYIIVGIERAEIAARNIRLPPDAFHAVVGRSGDRLSDEATIAALVAAAPMLRIDGPTGVTNMGVGGRFDINAHGLMTTNSIPDPYATAEPDETEKRAAEVMARATPLEKLILTRICDDDKTVTDVGKELGVCRERARQLKEAAIERLRDNGSTDIPLASDDAWWWDEARALRLRFEGRAVKMATLNAWARERYTISARRYLHDLLAWMVLDGRAEWFGDTVRFGGRRAKVGAGNPKRNVAA